MYVKYPIMGMAYAHGYFAICGGGGSMKSGIRNTVDIYQLSENDPSGFELAITVDTGRELASGVSFSPDGQLIAVAVNVGCWIYELDRATKALTLLVKFRTDFATDESSQTASCFVGNSTLLTGGEDGVVRVWKLSTEASPQEKAKGTSSALRIAEPEEGHEDIKPKPPAPATPGKPNLGDSAIHGSHLITLTREYRGHTKRIREIHVEPSHRNLVVSSSEDQSCHLWRLNEFTAICKLSKDDAIDIAYQKLQLKPLTGVKKHQFRCVRFANDGRTLYTVLTPARGDTLLLTWKPATPAQLNENEWQWELATATIAGDRPIASLCVSPDDRVVSTAAVAGDVRVYDATTLRPYKKTSHGEHTFAITGMGFMPEQDKSKRYLHLVTGGADKQLLRHVVPLDGGAIASGSEKFVNGVVGFFAGVANFILGSFMGALVLFASLLYVHVKHGLLHSGPHTGFEKLLALQFEAQDAQLALALSVGALIVAWTSFISSTVAGSLFWNGVVSVALSGLSFFIATSQELHLEWKTGDDRFDELLDYKISIILGACSIVFFFLHALVVKLR